MKFLEYVIGELYDRYGANMQSLTVVLPTRRAGLFAKDYLGRLAGSRPVFAPQCITIGDLFDRLCPLKAADEIKSVCELYYIYNKVVARQPEAQGVKPLTLDAFYGWGRQLITDFDNIEKGADGGLVEEILRNSKDARHFEESILDPEVAERLKSLLKVAEAPAAESDTSLRKRFEALWRSLPDIYRELTSQLQQDDCALEGRRYRWVVEHFAELVPHLKGHTFVFAGFNRLLAVERQLMQLMKEQGLTLFYWDYDSAFDLQHADAINCYRNVRRNIWKDDSRKSENLGGCYSTDDAHAADKNPIEVVAAPSDSAQARYVHDWLLRHHRKGDRTAVVLCNETQLEHVVFALPQQYAEEVNVTKGFPLRNTRIYADIVRQLHKGKDTGEGLRAVLQQLLDYIDGRAKECAALSETAEEDSADGKALPWHDLLDIESIWQARLVVVRFVQLMDEGVLSDLKELHTLRNLLLRHLSTVSIPFHGEPITDIQVIGVLETRALDFDNILFLNVEEGVLPRLSKDKSFIPYYLRKYYNLPTNDDQTEIYAYNFFRLLRCARQVTILYSDAQTAMGQKGMSRFVMQMLVNDGFDTCRRLLSESASVPRQITDEEAARQLRKQSGYRCYADLLRERAAAREGQESSLSPSAIKTFLTCRMKFFIRYMLGIAEPDVVDNLLQGNELGTLIHNSAEWAYKQITNGYTHPLTPEAIRAFRSNPAMVRRAVGEAFKMLNDDYRSHHDPGQADYYQPQRHQVEARVAEKHLQKILENDEHTPGLDIVKCEEDAFYTASLCGINLKIGGRIDRIDKVGNDYRIVDYKTGKYDDNNMKAATLDALFEEGQTKTGNFLQTLIYSLAVSSDRQAAKWIPEGARYYPALFYTQKKLDTFDPRLYLNGVALTDFAEVKDEFEAKLLSCVETILTTEDFPMTSSSADHCTYCRYRLLCHRGE